MRKTLQNRRSLKTVLGCFRTLNEIGSWSRMNYSQRYAVIAAPRGVVRIERPDGKEHETIP
ncbi:DUF1289 domain-containing protein [Roseibium sp. RKSG952]|uniref:DUF1289 domain-containing protein n=1 Tax=Roseibium sp. RKSG952 TaxID=2529384 RepID=UPI001AD8FD9B